MEVINYLLGYKNLKIYQNTDMFNFSLDSVLLPEFIKINKNTKKILDIGTGNAPIPLILSTKTNAQIIGIEIQKEVYDLAQKTIKLNNLEKQITIMNGDINELKATFPINSFDIITCNPPFFKVSENSNLNKNDYKTIARHEVKLNIDQICMTAKTLLKNGGIIGLVHRPERLTDIIKTMRNYNLEPKKIQFVHPRPDENANIVLIESVLNGKPGVKILPPLISHQANGEYTDQIKKYFE